MVHMMSLRYFVAGFRSKLVGLRERYREGGWGPAYIYWRACMSNAYIILRCELGAKPRVECPCCGWRGFDFFTYDSGRSLAQHSVCRKCRCQPRHRMLDLYIHRRDPEFFSGEGRVLHVAPESQVRDLVASNPNLLSIMTTYSDAPERKFPGIAFRSDIQYLPVFDQTFDYLFALHVLEHVPDDRKGIQELCRAMRPGGIAYIMVPFMFRSGKTVEFEEPDPADFDHVRGYSTDDFHERLSPFDYEAIHPRDFPEPHERRRYGIPEEGEILFRCARR